MKKPQITLTLIGILLFLALAYFCGCGEVKTDPHERTREVIAVNPPHRIIKCYETYYGTYWYYLQKDLGDCWDTMAETENTANVRRWIREYGMEGGGK